MPTRVEVDCKVGARAVPTKVSDIPPGTLFSGEVDGEQSDWFYVHDPHDNGCQYPCIILGDLEAGFNKHAVVRDFEAYSAVRITRLDA